MSLSIIIYSLHRKKEDDIMDNRLMKLLDSVPTLIENTHLEVFLEGWPAAFSIGSVCGTVVAVVAILTEAHRTQD